MGVNLGFNKSSSKSSSHSESAVVTTIKGKNGNSSITYNNVKNIEYIGTQAQNTKFIYNNVDNITGTTYQNGLFVNVDEEHNNIKIQFYTSIQKHKSQQQKKKS